MEDANRATGRNGWANSITCLLLQQHPRLGLLAELLEELGNFLLGFLGQYLFYQLFANVCQFDRRVRRDPSNTFDRQNAFLSLHNRRSSRPETEGRIFKGFVPGPLSGTAVTIPPPAPQPTFHSL